MKTLIYLNLIVLAAVCAFAQINAVEHEWRATLKVVDDNGSPVAGVNVGVGYYVGNTSKRIDGLTDTNGVFVAAHSASTSGYAVYDLAFVVEKAGYYQTWKKCDLGVDYNAAKWNPTVTLVLKKIGKPIAMYAKKYVLGLKLPEYGKQIGYDLMVGDWVGPYGKGVTSDFIFEQDYTNISSTAYYSEITVSFPKDGDGIQVYTIPDSETGSGLRSPHEAPIDGYQAKLTRETSAQSGQPSKFEYDPNRIYLFRVRTAVDDRGKIVSTHYGKIYGDFMQFTYYLNPTPNDQNIEFDLKQNLLHGLQSFEQVPQP
jgi:hypothetical protein